MMNGTVAGLCISSPASPYSELKKWQAVSFFALTLSQSLTLLDRQGVIVCHAPGSNHGMPIRYAPCYRLRVPFTRWSHFIEFVNAVRTS